MSGWLDVTWCGTAMLAQVHGVTWGVTWGDIGDMIKPWFPGLGVFDVRVA